MRHMLDFRRLALLVGLLATGPSMRAETSGAAHPIDQAMERYWKERGVVPAPLCGDDEFQRRLTLDLVGRIPTVDERNRYSASTDPGKRGAWVTTLLESPELARFWGERLASVMLGYPREATLGVHWKPMLARWITANLEKGKGYDEIVGDLVRSGSEEFPPRQGDDAIYPTFATVLLYEDGRGDRFEELLGRTAGVFLGVSLRCAQCHDHPRDRWTREDFEGMLGFYARLDRQTRAAGQPPRVWAPPVFLDGSTPREGFRRTSELARLITRPENVRFSRTAANRFWAHFMGWGLVEPLDDFRDGKHPAVPGLLEELGDAFAREGFHLKPFFRLLVTSSVYQLSSRAEGAPEIRAFERARLRPLGPEQLFGSIMTATEPRVEGKEREKLRGEFIRMIARTSDCDASSGVSEYSAGVQQVLRMADSHSALYAGARVGSGGMLDRILERHLPAEGTIREIYLAALGRQPDERDLRRCLWHLSEKTDPRAGFAEVFWALLSSNEFYFNH